MCVRFLLLGVAQDAGVPQTGCICPNCAAVRSGSMDQQYAVSGAVIDDDEKLYWLLDCSPDYKQQHELLRRHAEGYRLAGIFLTHLHMGHYLGLYQFGREGMGAAGVKVWGTPSVCNFLNSNQPWKNYVQAGTFTTHILSPSPEGILQLSRSVLLSAVSVPHRAEFSDCVAVYVQGPNKRMFYCPDIDSWDKWLEQGVSIQKVVQEVDLAFLDATFYDAEELPGRDMKEIPHPLIVDTLSRLAAVSSRVVLIHMNHTNPVYREGTAARAACMAGGLALGVQGAVYPL